MRGKKNPKHPYFERARSLPLVDPYQMYFRKKENSKDTVEVCG